ncbi:vascular endothelial growth factor receptor 1-like isoform X2 [Centruroides sculpturatus]|uniref:vascular endothelial growth factor receptor 1-like isoform X2 n=1 Tax=Centruroides sculpturatus TaxID=218467 RepID=UPI000C6D90EB|nr:vascular endothelial growth factor receptor 1-like isoform X2 [Centruroides sculpturatus]
MTSETASAFRFGIFYLALVANAGVRGGIARHPPRILDVREPADYPAGSNVTLECRGKLPVKWETPEHEEYDLRRSETSEGDEYRLNLTLVGVAYYQTGLYTCCYRNAACGDSRYSASVYLFVNDRDNPIVVYNDFVQANSGKSILLPCLPTFSDLKINLSVNEEDISAREGVTFDPRKGFVVGNADHTLDGSVACKTDRFGGFEEYLRVQVHHTPRPLEPFVTRSKDIPEEGEAFSLNCSVEAQHGTTFRIDWRLPGRNDGVWVEEESYFVDREDPDGRRTRFSSRRLGVERARRTDSGNYTCVVTPGNAQGTKYEVTESVRIYGRGQKPFVRLTLEEEEERVERRVGERALFRVRTEIVPAGRPVDYRWEKDGRPLVPDSRLVLRHGEGVAELRLSSLRPEDDGNYTLRVRSGEAEGNLTVLLRVVDRPRPTVRGAREWYLRNRTYVLSCEVKGHRASPPRWQWRSWKTTRSGGRDWEEASGRVAAVRLFGRRARAEVVARETGNFSCVSSNFVGEGRLLVPFVVTDVEDGLWAEPSEARPVEGDAFRLTCRADDFLFRTVGWRRRRPGLPDLPVEDDPAGGVRVTESDADFSLVAVLEFPSLGQRHRANYTCAATRRNDSSLWSETTVEVRVRAAEAPWLEETNMNGTRVVASAGQRYEFTCYARGVPPPRISWFKDDRLFNHSGHNGIELKDDSRRLVIERLLDDDSGFYLCRAENPAGISTANVTFVVAKDRVEARRRERERNAYTAVFAAVLALVLLILAALLIRKVLKEKREKKELEILTHAVFYKGRAEQINPDLPLDEQIDLLPYDCSWELPRECLKLGKTLGQGAFGRVVEAEARGLGGQGSTVVAVKMLKERADREQMKALMAELKILIHLRPHVNIVNLLGAVTENMAKGELMVVVEYCRYGNLRHYLLGRKSAFVPRSPSSEKSDYENLTSPASWSQSPGEWSRPSAEWWRGRTGSEEEGDGSFVYRRTGGRRESEGSESREGARREPVTTARLLYFAYQCARGMQYLSDRKLIHRDLAARNVLVADRHVVKICDFGLAKDCYKYSNYVKKNNGPLPIKWMAIESIRDKVFTTKSDVWSFGVLTWEIFSLGATPYPGMEVDAEFYKMLSRGFRMDRPEYAPPDLYEMIRLCWKAEPEERPTFAELSRRLREWVDPEDLKSYEEAERGYRTTDDRKTEYLRMGEATGPEKSSDDDSSAHYLRPGRVRPVGDGPVPAAPMEAVPMIQLDPVPPGRGKRPEEEPVWERRPSDYVCMKSPPAFS